MNELCPALFVCKSFNFSNYLIGKIINTAYQLFYMFILQIKKVENQKLQLMTSDEISYEKCSSYQLTIVCSDGEVEIEKVFYQSGINSGFNSIIKQFFKKNPCNKRHFLF